MHSIEMKILDSSSAVALLVTLGEYKVVLDTRDVDQLIDQLSLLRGEMLPKTSAHLAHSHQYVIEMDPRWKLVKNPLFDGLVMLLRHSGLGWSCFAIPDHSIARMLDAITKFIEPARTADSKYSLKN